MSQEEKDLSTTAYYGNAYLDDAGNSFYSGTGLLMCRGVRYNLHLSEEANRSLWWQVNWQSVTAFPPALTIEDYHHNHNEQASRLLWGKPNGTLVYPDEGPIEALCDKMRKRYRFDGQEVMVPIPPGPTPSGAQAGERREPEVPFAR